MSASEACAPPAKPPLAVDLDGTVIHTDLFFEAILRFLFAAPWKAPLLLLWLMKGRAYAKMRLAREAAADVETLPYDERVLAWLRSERQQGRTIVLATASDRRAAEAVANHLGLFDAVFASDGGANLKAARKAQALAEAFPQGFSYAGNEAADLKVWRAAAQAAVVNAPQSLSRRAGALCAIEASFAAPHKPFSAFLEAIRPQQWVKNFLVFLPLLVGQGWLDAAAWREACIAFGALSLVASSVYLVNDAADIDADRRHARKRTRPFARGALSPAWGLFGAALLFAGGLAMGALASVLSLLVFYAAAATLYTFWLKRIALVDVFVLASLYALRVVLGGVATGYFASGWLLAFCGFFFLSLALLKRTIEADALQARGGGAVNRRGYVGADGPMLKMMGVSAGLVAALVLALYLQDAGAVLRYHTPLLLWALPGLVVFWICRMWLLAERGAMHDDPLVFAFRDPASWALFLLTAALFLAAALPAPIF